MARTIFVDKQCSRITLEDWNKKSNTPAYYTVERYDNGVVQITLQWSGRVDRPDNYKDYWPVFVLLVKNYTSSGSLALDPVENDKTFATIEEGRAAYQKFLTHWTNCDIDEDGSFKEVDNTLLPADSLEEEKPEEKQNLGAFGSW
jgi:hypothetical protein